MKKKIAEFFKNYHRDVCFSKELEEVKKNIEFKRVKKPLKIRGKRCFIRH